MINDKDIISNASAVVVKVGILNAADYGVPQRRKRAIILASRTGLLPLPNPTHCNPQKSPTLFQNGLLPWETVTRAIEDLPAPVGIDLRIEQVPPPLDLHFGRTPANKASCATGAFRRAATGSICRRGALILPRCAESGKKPVGPTCLGVCGGIDLPSPYGPSFKPEKGRYLHPQQHRPITHREAARLQTFPDSFKFTGTKIEIAKQIGNAVPPLLGKKVAEVLLEHL